VQIFQKFFLIFPCLPGVANKTGVKKLMSFAFTGSHILIFSRKFAEKCSGLAFASHKQIARKKQTRLIVL